MPLPMTGETLVNLLILLVLILALLWSSLSSIKQWRRKQEEAIKRKALAEVDLKLRKLEAEDESRATNARLERVEGRQNQIIEALRKRGVDPLDMSDHYA